MKIKNLNPSQIISSGEFELGNKEVLRTYFSICDRGGSEYLPPVITLKSGDPNKVIEFFEEDLLRREKRYANEKDASKYLPIIKMRRKDYADLLFNRINEEDYLLIDGNHRAVASALSKSIIPAFEIETEEDLCRIRQKVKEGELNEFNRKEVSIEALRNSWFSYVLGYGTNSKNLDFCMDTKSRIKYTKNIEERAKELTKANKLPKSILNRLKSKENK